MKNLDILLEDYIAEYPHEHVANSMLDFFNNDENCFNKENKIGHFTGSAWIVSPDRSMVLMTHHRKLNMWLQLGGHADGTEDLISVAIREAKEESGFNEFILLSDKIFDLDIHEVPAVENEPVHYHYDVIFLLEAELIIKGHSNKKTIDFVISECRTPTFFTQYNLASKDKVI